MPAWGAEIRLDTVTPKLRDWTERMRAGVAEEVDVVGQDMVDLARQIVPVRTGFLQSTIMFEINREDFSFTFGASADYAEFVEFGTRKMQAQPFIRPAMDANEGKLLDAVLAGVLNALS